MTTTPRTVVFFAGSKLPNDPDLTAACQELGRRLGAAGYNVTYGAGTGGLMGATALAAHAAGAAINAFSVDDYGREEQIPGVSVTPVANEYARFQQMTAFNNPIALIMLPGGPGSLREAMQGLEGAVYYQGPPVLLLKVKNYSDGIKDAFNNFVDLGLINPQHRDKMQLLNVDEIMDFVNARDAGPGRSNTFSYGSNP